MVKVNIDGAFPIAENLGAISSIHRDHTGRLIGGFTKSVPASSALIIETDCLILVEVMHRERLPPWDCRALLAECADVLPSFSNLTVTHCSRSANALTDWAAKAHGRGFLPPTWA